jgi:hypothetical protein
MKNLLVVFIGIILLSSCKKDDAEDIPQPPTPTNNGTILDSISITGEDVPFTTRGIRGVKLKYDSQSRLILVTTKDSLAGTPASNNELYKHVYTYSGNSTLPTKRSLIEVFNNFEESTNYFTFNSQGKLIKDSLYTYDLISSTNNNGTVNNYFYADPTKVIRTKTYYNYIVLGGSLYQIDSFFINSTSNIAVQNTYQVNPLQKFATSNYAQHDAKINPISGLFLDDVFSGDFVTSYLTSKNNALKWDNITFFNGQNISDKLSNNVDEIIYNTSDRPTVIKTSITRNGVLDTKEKIEFFYK